MTYSAYEPLVARARPKSELWRLALGLVLIGAGFLALNQVYFAAFKAILDTATWKTLGQELIHGSTPRSVIVMLFNFLALAISLALVVRFLHGRSLRDLVGPRPLVIRDFLTVMIALLALNMAYWFLPWPGKIDTQAHLEVAVWLRWLPVALIAIFVQIGTEELIFRGYIQGHLAARFRSPLVWMLLPSLVFAALHFDPGTFGPNAPLVALWAGIFAFAAADVTARAGNLGPALAMHFANNIGAILINAVAGNWDGLALQTLPLDPAQFAVFKGVILAEGALILFSWLMARLAIGR